MRVLQSFIQQSLQSCSQSTIVHTFTNFIPQIQPVINTYNVKNTKTLLFYQLDELLESQYGQQGKHPFLNSEEF